MVNLSPSVATPKMAKSKTPKKNGAVDTPEVKTPKQEKKTPAKAALQTPKGKKETLGKDEKSTPKVSALKTHKISKEAKSTPKAAIKTSKKVTASANKNKKPVEDFEMESEEEEEALAPQASLKKNVNNSEDAVMSSEEDSEEEEFESKSDKSTGNKGKSNKAAGKRKLEDSNQSGGDQKRQKITYDNEIFIARLSFNTSTDTLREHFSQFGEVVNVGMPLKPKKQSNKGFAFVAFKEASAMKKALADTNQEIDSTKIVVEPKKTEKTVSKESIPKPSHPNELFVGGLNKSTEKHVLEEYFSKYGTVGNVTLPWNQKDKRNKGYGFISFESAASLQSALEDDHEIDGKEVAVHTAGKKSEENLVVPKKAETKKVKAALAKAAVAEEDEDEEMEGEEDEDEEGDSDDEAEGEEGDSDDEAEGEEDEGVEGDSDDEAEGEKDEVEEGDSDDEDEVQDSDSDDQYEGVGNDDEEGCDDDD